MLVHATTAEIIAGDFCTLPTDSLLQTEIAQRLAVATRWFKKMRRCCSAAVVLISRMAAPSATVWMYALCNTFVLSALHTVPFVISVIGLSNYLRDSNSSVIASV